MTTELPCLFGLIDHTPILDERGIWICESCHTHLLNGDPTPEVGDAVN